MIVTVTLNPGPDRTLTVPTIEYDEVLRATSLRVDWGGKGLNVSRALKALGAASIATGFAGGYAGQMVLDGLADLGIATDFVRIRGETRTNTVILEESTGRYIKVNEAGPRIQPGELDRFLAKVTEMAKRGDIWVIGGRPPVGVPDGMYARLTWILQGAGAKVLLDTSGETLRQGSTAGPFLVKPNLLEATEMLEAGAPAPPEASAAVISDQVRESATRAGALDQIRFFLDRGAQLVALSMGAGGLLLASSAKAVWARPPKVRARNPVGAGDALLAALAWSLGEGMGLREMARWGVAAGTASALHTRVGFDTREEVEALLSGVRID